MKRAAPLAFLLAVSCLGNAALDIGGADFTPTRSAAYPDTTNDQMLAGGTAPPTAPIPTLDLIQVRVDSNEADRLRVVFVHAAAIPGAAASREMTWRLQIWADATRQIADVQIRPTGDDGRVAMITGIPSGGGFGSSPEVQGSEIRATLPTGDIPGLAGVTSFYWLAQVSGYTDVVPQGYSGAGGPYAFADQVPNRGTGDVITAHANDGLYRFPR